MLRSASRATGRSCKASRVQTFLSAQHSVRSMRATTERCPSEEPINLLRGWPSASLLPADLIRNAANTVLSDSAISTPALWYGPDPGYEPLRENIAKWLTEFYTPREAITASRICITGGASQNLGCMLSVYTDPEYTRAVWIVAPAYFLAFRVFEDAGFGVDGKMRAVPEDEEGLDIEFLRREMRKREEAAKKSGVSRPRFKPERTRAKVYKHVIYCVPTFSNPSSRTMSLARREQLVTLAREFDALVICDDVYDVLQWPAIDSTAAKRLLKAHLPRLVDIDREIDGGALREGADGFGNACSNGTFSKMAGPGIRVGWVEGTEKFAFGVSQTGTTCSGGAPSQLTSTYINELLETNAFQQYIQTVLLPAYASRYQVLMRAIRTHLLPLGFLLPQADREVIGGYFMWLRLPQELRVSAKTLAKKCMDQQNVVIAGGNIFEVPGDVSAKFDREVRLCWAWEDEWKLEEGVRRVAEVVVKLLEDGSEESFVVVDSEEGVEDFK